MADTKKTSTPTKDNQRRIESGRDGAVRKDSQIPRRESGYGQDSADRPTTRDSLQPPDPDRKKK
ncbi:hypothetical protein AB4Y45_28025 [Paraburkholderia sp. EG287A]|uniref:hypothetical protein n=1 Tax=Paraburkholderia sp. EG287A TaxID=3237012 RepID=UPI0034D27035